jgi:hypothetical protein
MDELSYLIAAKLQADRRLKNENSDGSQGGSRIGCEAPSKKKDVPRPRLTMTDSWRLVHLR